MVITFEQVARIIALVEDGCSQRYAARILGLPETCVRRAIQRFRETGLYTRRPGSGRPRASGPTDDRFLLLHTLRNRQTTASLTAQNLHAVRGISISAETVRRRLAEMHLQPRRPATGPLLTVDHRRACLEFTRQHLHWAENEWRSVLFTDESRFALHSPDGRVRVYRRRGERYAACNIVGRVQFGGGSVLVWGGILLEDECRIFLNAESYVTDILEEYVMPYSPFIGENFILM